MGNINSLETKTNVKLSEMQELVKARGKDSLYGAGRCGSVDVGERGNTK